MCFNRNRRWCQRDGIEFFLAVMCQWKNPTRILLQTAPSKMEIYLCIQERIVFLSCLLYNKVKASGLPTCNLKAVYINLSIPIQLHSLVIQHYIIVRN